MDKPQVVDARNQQVLQLIPLDLVNPSYGIEGCGLSAQVVDSKVKINLCLIGGRPTALGQYIRQQIVLATIAEFDVKDIEVRFVEGEKNMAKQAEMQRLVLPG